MVELNLVELNQLLKNLAVYGGAESARLLKRWGCGDGTIFQSSKRMVLKVPAAAGAPGARAQQHDCMGSGCGGGCCGGHGGAGREPGAHLRQAPDPYHEVVGITLQEWPQAIRFTMAGH